MQPEAPLLISRLHRISFQLQKASGLPKWRPGTKFSSRTLYMQGASFSFGLFVSLLGTFCFGCGSVAGMSRILRLKPADAAALFA